MGDLIDFKKYKNLHTIKKSAPRMESRHIINSKTKQIDFCIPDCAVSFIQQYAKNMDTYNIDENGDMRFSILGMPKLEYPCAYSFSYNGYKYTISLTIMPDIVIGLEDDLDYVYGKDRAKDIRNTYDGMPFVTTGTCSLLTEDGFELTNDMILGVYGRYALQIDDDIKLIFNVIPEGKNNVVEK